METTKKCCRCLEVKPLSAYYTQGGACKNCTKERQRQLWAARTPEQVKNRQKSQKAYEKNNLDMVRGWARKRNKEPKHKEWLLKYREEKKDLIKLRAKEYYLRNIDAIRQWRNEWQRTNSEKCKEYYRRYMSKPEVCKDKSIEAKKRRDELSDGYIRTVLTRRTLIDSASVPNELVEAKRMQVKIKRLTKSAMTNVQKSKAA